MSNTIVEQQKAVISFNQSRVCDLLQWQPDHLSQFIYTIGFGFLDAVFGNDTAAIEMMEKHSDYWAWWKNQWNIRDEAWLHQVDGREDELDLDYRNKLYRINHKVDILKCELSIPRTVFPKDFTTVKMEM